MSGRETVGAAMLQETTTGYAGYGPRAFCWRRPASDGGWPRCGVGAQTNRYSIPLPPGTKAEARLSIRWSWRTKAWRRGMNAAAAASGGSIFVPLDELVQRSH